MMNIFIQNEIKKTFTHLERFFCQFLSMPKVSALLQMCFLVKMGIFFLPNLKNYIPLFLANIVSKQPCVLKTIKLKRMMVDVYLNYWPGQEIQSIYRKTDHKQELSHLQEQLEVHLNQLGKHQFFLPCIQHIPHWNLWPK